MSQLQKIIHIDMDAFFASVEQLDNPKLKGKPVIVGGDPGKRGVVAACSYEARNFGIHSAMPCSRAVKLCPHAVFIKPRIWRYQQISKKIMSIFSCYTNIIEPLSIDEAFLDVTINKYNNPSATRLAEIIRRHIFAETGLTASAGISYNKFLAKVASDINKPNGQNVIEPDKALVFLDTLPIGKFYGIGKVTEKKMHDLGIRYGAQLKKFSKEDLIFHFGKSGVSYYSLVRGIDERPVQPARERKSIGCETTFQGDTRNMEEIDNTLNQLAERIAGVLAGKKCYGSTVTLKVRYQDFTTVTRSQTLKNPINTQLQIYENLPQLLQGTEIGRKKVRLLGITLSKLTSTAKSNPIQLLLPFEKRGNKQFL